MTYVHTLDDPWAAHPVANRHICYGGGGGGGGSVHSRATRPACRTTPSTSRPMTATGNTLQGYGKELFDWAKQARASRSPSIADKVSGRAGELADYGAGQYKDMMAKWKSTYGDIYDAQAADASRMIGELPRTEEQYAGK